MTYPSKMAAAEAPILNCPLCRAPWTPEPDLAQARLCYIDPDRSVAWFTTRDLDKQQGDDWNDVPYEDNAGVPYPPFTRGPPEQADRPGEWRIWRAVFDVDATQPHGNALNSPYCVNGINAGRAPWLFLDRTQKPVPAGTTFVDFCVLVHAAGGSVGGPVESTQDSR